MLAGLKSWFPPWLCGCRKELEEINVKLSELAEAVQGVSDQLAKAQAEIVEKIADLEGALSDMEIPADAQAAIDGLKTAAQGLDDIVPG